jgi:hypothetical protein
MFVSDVMYARSLKQAGHVLWYSETSKPDLGGNEDVACMLEREREAFYFGFFRQNGTKFCENLFFFNKREISREMYIEISGKHFIIFPVKMGRNLKLNFCFSSMQGRGRLVRYIY